MKKNKLLFILAMALCMIAGKSFAQDKKEAEIKSFEAGRVITKDDMGFLSMINGKSRGDGKAVEICNGKVTPGQKLNEADAKCIAGKINAYYAAHKPEKTRGKTKSRGTSYCEYVWWCSGDYCYWYWYCY
uniref:Uncharacterized protein n=1 Tax=uncultured bacterium BLR17 TaxID=506517 RepID=C0INK6_9BACT|nr:hypothetical protein AKSOIL_0277 [uncultured bacterium BLR17]